MAFLCGDDLIHVEAPAAGHGLAYLTVLGAGGQTFGLGFFDSETDYDEVETAQSPNAFLDEARWSLFFGAISDLPFGDADLWERHDLPVAGEHAYPLAIQFDRRRTPRRPDAGTLAYLEGLLRALGGTSEDEMDRGRWTRSVETYDGTAAYRLCIPALLEPLRGNGCGPPCARGRCERAAVGTDCPRKVPRHGAASEPRGTKSP